MERLGEMGLQISRYRGAKMNSKLSEFETEFDELIKTHLKDVDQAEIDEHFRGISVRDHIKLIKWSAK